MTEFDLFLFNLKRKKKLKIWNNNNWIDLLNLLKWANFLLKINTICIILSANIPNTNSTKSKIVWNSYSLNHLLYMYFVWATTRKKNSWISVLISLKYFYLFIGNIYFVLSSVVCLFPDMKCVFASYGRAN